MPREIFRLHQNGLLRVPQRFEPSPVGLDEFALSGDPQMTDSRQHFFRMHRLRNVVHSSDLQPGDFALGVIERGRKIIGMSGRGGIRFQPGAGFKTPSPGISTSRSMRSGNGYGTKPPRLYRLKP